MTTIPVPPTVESWFQHHVLEQAPVYFPDLDPSAPIQVRLLERQLRPASQLFWFRLTRPDAERGVILKMPRAAVVEGATPVNPRTERPRFGSVASSAEKYILEFTALQAIHRHFPERGDPRFGTVRPYELLPTHRALVMEAIEQQSLKQVLRARGGRGDELHRVFNNAGAWLRSFHAIPKGDHIELRHATREEFVGHALRILRFLERFPSAARIVRDARVRLPVAARKHLPTHLPLGVAHGDYALRNILVGDGGRVTVIDTLARWRTCIFEDIGTFLVDLKHGGSPLRGWLAAITRDQIAEYEAEFLRGYFGDAIPEGAVRVYEFQALLDRWAAQMSRRESAQYFVSIAAAIRAAAAAAFLTSRVRRSVNALL